MKPTTRASPGGLTPPLSWAAHTPDSTVDSSSWATLRDEVPRCVDPPRTAGLTRFAVCAPMVIPMVKGGKDTPANMQPLCGDALKAKEKTELR